MWYTVVCTPGRSRATCWPEQQTPRFARHDAPPGRDHLAALRACGDGGKRGADPPLPTHAPSASSPSPSGPGVARLAAFFLLGYCVRSRRRSHTSLSTSAGHTCLLHHPGSRRRPVRWGDHTHHHPLWHLLPGEWLPQTFYSCLEAQCCGHHRQFPLPC